MEMNILSTIAETWQVLAVIGIALSVGYATARKFV